MKHRVIGIDLGTTYSAVAIWDHDEEEAEVIPNREEGGQATTPSVVAWDPAARMVSVGWVAKRSLAVRPQDAITEIKREMGERFDSDRSLQRYHAEEQFTADDPVHVRFAGEWRKPQEISALVLTRMKEIAEAELGEEIRDAVITVPAYFLEIQRKATEQAARLAGLWPRRLVAEPTAAAICYGVDQYEEARRAYLVYDLGGGTFDVSIIEVEREEIRVIATSGDHHLGGGDFDDAIMEWAANELVGPHELPKEEVDRAKPMIKYHAEQAKVRLSAHQETTLELPELRRGAPPVLTLTRERFDELIDWDVQRSLRKVEDAIRQAAAKGVGRDQLDAVLLVGGSTKIPKVKRMLADYFGRGEDFVRLDLDPAAVVARGAAILARTFQSSDGPFDPASDPPERTLAVTPQGDPLPIEPITEHSLGTGLEDGTCHRLIERGTTIPVTSTHRNFTNAEATDTIRVGIYQGEGKFYRDNTLIGTLVLDDLKWLPRGEHHFDLTYALNENGLLKVRAEYHNSGQGWDATIDHPTLVDGGAAMRVLYERTQQLYRSGRQPPQPELDVPLPP
jgi:molecular chaperone DnaK (HSP70)